VNKVVGKIQLEHLYLVCHICRICLYIISDANIKIDVWM